MTLRILCLTLLATGLACSDSNGNSGAAATRAFHFEYKTTMTSFPSDAKQARVWLPLPVNDEAQEIENLKVESSVTHRVGTEKIYGNRIAYFEVNAPFPDSLDITVSMDVHRKEVSSVSKLPIVAEPDRLLAGDQLAPINDEAKSRAVKATAGKSETLAQARGIYDQVLADVDYDKSGLGWGQGNLEYVCDEGKGNCSDFHTLFIAMARSKEIPSVFEIGFPLPAGKTEGTIGGYHCWAWYQQASGDWRPIDASEADKDPTRTEYFFGTVCENRIAFSRGRDLVLDPPQAGPPVNFLIYPYVEVDGKTDVAKVEKAFSFSKH